MGLFLYFVYCTILFVVCSCETSCRNVYYNISARDIHNCPQLKRLLDEAHQKACQDCAKQIETPCRNIYYNINFRDIHNCPQLNMLFDAHQKTCQDCAKQIESPCRNVYYNIRVRDIHNPWQRNRLFDEAHKKTCQDSAKHIKNLASSLRTLQKQMEILKEKRNEGETSYSDCQSVYEGGERKGGLVKVRPDMNPPIEVYCDMSDGGWAVIQRRLTGDVSFNRDWKEYKNGFGSFSGDFWLGNERIYRLTSNADYKLRIEIQLFNGSWYHATYQHFRVENESDRFRLRVSNYSGNAGDPFINNGTHLNVNNKPFSTPDFYPGSFCAKYSLSGWWFNSCTASNLNGVYHIDAACTFDKNFPWCPYWLMEEWQALKATVMKIKRN